MGGDGVAEAGAPATSRRCCDIASVPAELTSLNARDMRWLSTCCSYGWSESPAAPWPAGDDDQLVVDDRQPHPSAGGEIERGRRDRARRHPEAVGQQRHHGRRLERAAVDRRRLLVGRLVGRDGRRGSGRVLRPEVVQPAGERRQRRRSSATACAGDRRARRASATTPIMRSSWHGRTRRERDRCGVADGRVGSVPAMSAASETAFDPARDGQRPTHWQ